MGNSDLTTDLIQGVADNMAEVGSTRILRLLTESAIDVNDPGAAPTITLEDIPIECFLFDFIQEYMPNASVINGGTMALLDMTGLTEAQYDQIEPGNEIVDGSKVYNIILTTKIEADGVPTMFIVQLKG